MRPSVRTVLLVMMGVSLGLLKVTAQRAALDPSVGDGGVSAFYQWDSAVPAAGAMLRQEPLPVAQALANASRSLRVLYSSTDGVAGRGSVTVSGSVFLPKGEKPANGWPVVAYAHGTTGVADVCAPSWTGSNQRIVQYWNNWLAEGYAVVATDYQGLGTPGPHPWMTVRPEAYSVLDSVRAALGAFPELSNAVLLVGQSQGAHAVISAALLAPEYAPGLQVKGTVATAVPSSAPYLPSSDGRIPPVADAGLVMLRLHTFRALDPAFTPDQYVSAGGRAVLQASRAGCPADFLRVAAEQKVTVENALEREPVEAAVRAIPFQQYPPLRFAHPVFIATGLADTTAAPSDQHRFATLACAAGSTVERHYYPNVDHAGTTTASQPDSIPFARKVLAGQSVASACGNLAPPQ